MFTPLSALNSTVGYRLVFTGIGTALTGQIFALGDLNDPLATVTLVNATYQSGLAGLLTTGLVGGFNTAWTRPSTTSAPRRFPSRRRS